MQGYHPQLQMMKCSGRGLVPPVTGWAALSKVGFSTHFWLQTTCMQLH